MCTFTYCIAFVVQAKVYTIIIYYKQYQNSAIKKCIKVPTFIIYIHLSIIHNKLLYIKVVHACFVRLDTNWQTILGNRFYNIVIMRQVDRYKNIIILYYILFIYTACTTAVCIQNVQRLLYVRRFQTSFFFIILFLVLRFFFYSFFIIQFSRA